MRTNLLLLCLVIFFSACNKEKQLSKKLEGTWEVVSHASNGNISALEINGSRFEFAYCAPSEKDCAGSWSGTLANGQPFNFSYEFTISNEDYIKMQFNPTQVDTLIEDYINAQLIFVEDTLELEFISNGEFFEFTMVK